MFAPANAPHFTLHIDGVGHELQVLEFHGRETFGQPYRFELELVSERPDLELESLLNQPAFLAFATGGTGVHVSTETGVATYRRVYHEDRDGRRLNKISGKLGYSPLEGLTLPAIDIEDIAWL